MFKKTTLVMLMFAASALSAAEPVPLPEATSSGAMTMTARTTPTEACTQGDMQACLVAGLQALSDVAKNDAAKKDAEKLLTQACDGKVAEACRHLGTLMLNGEVFKANPAEGLKRLKMACDLKDERSCNRVVDHYDEQHDEKGMVTYLGKACEAGDNNACMRAVALDPNGNIEWVVRACELGRMDACLDAATRFDKGDKAKKDPVAALKYYEAACKLENAPSCMIAARMYEEGRGTQVNKEKALEWYDLACQRRMVRACAHIGDMYLEGDGIKKDIKKSQFYHNIACATGFRASCSKAGRE